MSQCDKEYHNQFQAMTPINTNTTSEADSSSVITLNNENISSSPFLNGQSPISPFSAFTKFVF